jgi:uroporphyrin-3 C-methyltransferase
MSETPSAPTLADADTAPQAPIDAVPVVAPFAVTRAMVWGLSLALLLALVLIGAVWQRLNITQEQLAKQSAESGFNSQEARTLARQAQEQVRETAARQALMEARLSEVTLQRSQLEALIQSLSRSRDENLVVDMESSLRLAQQQAQLTGSVEPLVATLKSAEQRLTRASQPRLAAVQRALQHDLARVKAATVSDTPALLLKMDEVIRLIDDLPLSNGPVSTPVMAPEINTSNNVLLNWWQRALDLVWQEARGLVRVSRIDQPEAALLSPDQSFFVRENLKLRLLNARLGLLARQLDASRSDLLAASRLVATYFNPAAKKTQLVLEDVRQMQGQMRTLELPRVDESLAALSAAAAGR